MPQVWIEQWVCPGTLQTFERIWTSTFWRRVWTTLEEKKYHICKWMAKMPKLLKRKNNFKRNSYKVSMMNKHKFQKVHN